MKLLLTSTGLSSPAIKDAFFHLVGQDGQNVTVAFIPTAADPEAIMVQIRDLFGSTSNWSRTVEEFNTDARATVGAFLQPMHSMTYFILLLATVGVINNLLINFDFFLIGFLKMLNQMKDNLNQCFVISSEFIMLIH